MGKLRTLVFILVVAGLTFGLAVSANATPNEQGLFFGFGTGDASLNNSLYLYSSENNIRQPEFNVQETSEYSGPVSNFYLGYTFTTKQTTFLNSSALQLGIQIGYTDLGEFTNTATYFDPPSATGYRIVEESAIDLLLTSNLYWENGFNLFAKAGFARLSGKYTQEGLRNCRQPEVVPEKASFSTVQFRPELVVGAGFLIADKCNLYVQYGIIFGEKPTTWGIFDSSEMVELPNTLYQAEFVTLGVTYYL